MKIYHTETQSDYDALMIKLEAEGPMWHGEGKPTSWNGWSINSNETCVIIRGPRIAQACLISCKNYYPKIPIIKYKAKAEDKMKFTEDNANKLFSKYRKCADYSLSELQDEILKLDDKLEKVFAPKSVALFYENVKHYKLEEVFNQFEKTSDKEVSNWYFNQKGRYDNNIANAQETIAKMHLYGYEIEKEQLYEVVIHETEDDRLLLVANKSGYKIELESDNEGFWKQRHTEKEIKAIDKRYWPFAVPVEEEK